MVSVHIVLCCFVRQETFACIVSLDPRVCMGNVKKRTKCNTRFLTDGDHGDEKLLFLQHFATFWHFFSFFISKEHIHTLI